MKRRDRVGSVVACEGVDPHRGSYLAHGIIIGWANDDGKLVSRSKATSAIIDVIGRIGDWDEWGKQNAWRMIEE